MKLIDGDKLERHMDYLIQKEKQLAKKCSLSPDNEFERQRRYCFEANALAYELCKIVMNYYLVTDTQIMNQWISVDDSLPEDRICVLVYDGGVCIAWRYKDEWESDDYTLGTVTHWQPLPEPPKEG